MAYTAPTNIKTTVLGVEIIKEAERWLAKYCKEEGTNAGACIVSLKNDYNDQTGKGVLKEASYCAQTVTVFFGNALKKFGKKNPIPTAGARDLKNRAKKAGIRVDHTPVAGCVFYNEPIGSGTGHVGLVWSVEGDYVRTIEGNSKGYLYDGSNFTKNTYEGVMAKKRKISSINDFIHIEEYGGYDDIAMYKGFGETTGIMQAGSSKILVGVVALTALGTFLYNRYK